MTNEDLTRMAHEAGMVPHRPFALAHLRDFAARVAAAERVRKVECECPVEGHGAGCPNDRLLRAAKPVAARVNAELERFAALVAAAEREAAAMTAKESLQRLGVDWAITEAVMKDIRARGEKK
jgi:hypothetical protein